MDIKIFEMFAGYGGATFSLKKLNLNFECVGYSEVKKHAIRCYEKNHPNIKNFGDCTKIVPETLPNFNLLTAGFPCQAFSMAGKRKGLEDSRGTLFRDIIRIASIKKPTYMVLENVAGLPTHENGNTLRIILKELRSIGYGYSYKVLNSLDYGTPQSRERIWIVCKLGGWEFMEYQFPHPTPLKKKWKDFVDEEKNFKKVNKTPSRDEMREKCVNITNKPYCYTLSSKQDRYPNSGIIDFQDYYRFLTPKECFRLMGFENDEIDISMLSIAEAYDLAGNGWDINVASKVIKNIYDKKRLPNDKQKLQILEVSTKEKFDEI